MALDAFQFVKDKRLTISSDPPFLLLITPEEPTKSLRSKRLVLRRRDAGRMGLGQGDGTPAAADRCDAMAALAAVVAAVEAATDQGTKT